jgi:predicted N-acetyltransferase YhbS
MVSTLSSPLTRSAARGLHITPVPGRNGLCADARTAAQHFALTVPPLNCTIGDLDWWCATTNDPATLSNARLWFDEPGALIAFVWPRANHVEVMIRPNHRRLEETILTQAEAEYRQQPAEGDEPRRLQYWSNEGDHERSVLLQAHGYTRTDEYLTFHTYPLTESLPARPVPAGYTIRHVQGEADLEPRVAAHRSAFHPSRMTVEKHRAVMASPTYRPELNLMVVAPNGTVAACTIVWFDDVNRMGIFEPVACHQDYQRRGLAGAVMVEGLRRLSALGAQVAHVNAWREDSAGAMLYRALGFTVTGRIFAWEKSI